MPMFAFHLLTAILVDSRSGFCANALKKPTRRSSKFGMVRLGFFS